MADILALWETIKKDNHGKHYYDQRKHFSPFVLSVDGIIGREALVVLLQIEFSHGREKVQTPVASTGRGKWPN